MISENDIFSRILWIRGKKVMIDRDLAELYGVSTKRLNEQVKRNALRFPEDFMFQLSEAEKKEVVAICDHLKVLLFSPNLPFVFTEHGAVMLASVLNSERAILANIQIVRVFTDMRELTLSSKEIWNKIEKLEQQLGKHDKELMVVFETIRKMIEKPPVKRNRIGFLRDEE